MKILIKHILVASTLILLNCAKLLAQAPNISYANSPASISRSAAVGTTPNPSLTITNSGGTVSTTFGYSSTATQPLIGGSFNNPARGAVDAAGNIYVASFSGNNISKFTSAGALVTNNYTSVGTLSSPSEIVFDSSGNMFVLNSTGTLLKYNSAGVFISSSTITVGGTTYGMCIAANNDIYITSANGTGGTDRIVKFTSALVQTSFTYANLNDPSEIGISAANNLYVLNLGSGNITVCNTSGGNVAATFATGYGTTGYGLAVDAINGYVYAATNAASGTLRVYNVGTSNGATAIATVTGVPNSYGLFLDGKGNVYIPNWVGNVVNRYRPSGQYFIDKTLPAGLSFSKTNGTISGTATASTPPANYTVSGYNATGGSTTVLNLNTFSNFIWDGSSNTSWTNTANWAGNAVPGANDRATIGNSQAYTNEPVIPTGTTINVGSIVLGTFDNSASTITVNGTGVLNVNGDIIYQSDANSVTNNAFVGLISGTGTINAINLKMTANTGLSATYTLKLSSSITNLNISGDISLTTTYISARANNATFTISGGTVTATDLITNNGANAAATSTLAMTSGTLNFTDPSALAGL